MNTATRIIVGITGAAMLLGVALSAPMTGAADSNNGSLPSNSTTLRQHVDGVSGECVGVVPAQVLNLANWKLTVPVKNRRKPAGGALEIDEPRLASYQLAPWFVTRPGCHSVQFRAAVNGVTTNGSKYPRSELREMSKGGREDASWSSDLGTHTMTIREAIVHLPARKPDVVAGQIHDPHNDVSVFRLEGHKLYITNGNDDHYKLVTSDYVLGTVFEVKYVVGDGKIKAYYNGVLQTTITKHFSGAYFKAGVYTQANCSNSSPCNDDNYGEVLIYLLVVTNT